MISPYNTLTESRIDPRNPRAPRYTAPPSDSVTSVKTLGGNAMVTAESVIVVWHVRPGQTLPAHVHPHGQDTWTVLAGRADYLAGDGVHRPLAPGDIAVAAPGQVHGAVNTASQEDFVFVSVVAPGAAGYERVDPDDGGGVRTPPCRPPVSGA